MTLNYDDTNPLSIEQYGKRLEGKTFYDVVNESSIPYEEKEAKITSYSNKSRKGGLGNLIEELYFGYKPNSNQEPDFPKAGVELKASPYEFLKNGHIKAGERLVITMIDYNNPIEEDYYKSHVYEKTNKMLLIYYHRNKSLENNLQYPIDYVKLYSPPEEDLLIIQEDFRKINEKIRAGKAHELSEGDTMYLGASTKGANAKKSTVSQFYNPDVKARKRAYSLKNGFMTQVLNKYIIHDIDTYEPIVKNIEELREKSFEDIVQNRINQHIGKTDKQLCEEFDRPYNSNKAQWSELAFRMLGIKGNHALEFIKANIKVKAIRINENNTIKESSPLPTMALIDIAVDEWEESELFEYFESTKFLFVVFKEVGENYVLKGCQFWNMPKNLLETEVKKGYEQIAKVIKDGIEFMPEKQKSGVIIRNNLPKKAANEVIHMRPHSAKAFYVFEDGTEHGSGKIGDSELLPDGRRMTKQSFWINNDFIYSILEDLLKKS